MIAASRSPRPFPVPSPPALPLFSPPLSSLSSSVVSPLSLLLTCVRTCARWQEGQAGTSTNGGTRQGSARLKQKGGGDRQRSERASKQHTRVMHISVRSPHDSPLLSIHSFVVCERRRFESVCRHARCRRRPRRRRRDGATGSASAGYAGEKRGAQVHDGRTETKAWYSHNEGGGRTKNVKEKDEDD